MPNKSRSTVFKANPEGFKRWGQPNWELNMWLPAYDKRLGNIAYTGIPKTDVASDAFASERIATFEFGVGSANDVEGRAILNSSSTLNVSYSIGNGDVTTDNYPNYPNPISLASTANTILNFASSSGKYILTEPSKFFNVEVRGDGRLEDMSDVAINSAVGYSLIIPGQYGDFLFNKALVFISNSVTNESYLFGILYFNANITKRAFSSVNGQVVPDVKIRFNVMLTTSADSSRVSETEMDNYVIFGNSSDFVKFGNLVYTDKTIVDGNGFAGTLRDNAGLRGELSLDQFMAFQSSPSEGTFGTLAPYGSGLIQERSSWIGNVLNRFRNNITLDALKSQLPYGEIENDILADSTAWMASKGNSFGYKVRSILGHGSTSTPSPLTHKYGIRFHDLKNSDVIGHDSFLKGVSNSEGHLYGDYGDSDNSTYTHKTVAEVQSAMDLSDLSTFWGAYAKNVNNSTFRGYNLKLESLDGSSVIGRCSSVSAIYSIVNASRSFMDAKTQVVFGDAKVDGTWMGVGIHSPVIRKDRDFIENTASSDARQLPVIDDSAFSGSEVFAFGSTLVSQRHNRLSSIKALSSISSLVESWNSDIQAESSTVSGDLKHSDVNLQNGSIANSYNSDVFIEQSISEGSFNSDVILNGIRKYVSASLEVVTKNVGTNQNIGFATIDGSDLVKVMIDRFIFMAHGRMDLKAFSFIENQDGTFDIGNSTNGSFGLVDYSAVGKYPKYSGNLTYKAIAEGIQTSYQTDNADYYLQIMDSIDFSTSGTTGYLDQALKRSYMNIWRMRSIDEIFSNGTLVKLNAYGDIPLSALIDTKYADADAKPSYREDDEFVTATANGSPVQQKLKLTTLKGGYGSLNLYDIVCNVDTDYTFPKNLLTVDGDVKLVRTIGLFSMQSVQPDVSANVSIAGTQTLKTWNFNTKSIDTTTVSNYNHLNAKGFFGGGNWYMTMMIRSGEANAGDSGEIRTFKVTSQSWDADNGEVMFHIKPVSQISASKFQSILQRNGDAYDFGTMSFWAVDDAKEALLQKIWATQGEYSKLPNSFYIGLSDEKNPTTLTRIGITRVVRFGLFHTMASRINSDESSVSVAINSNIDALDSAIGRSESSLINGDRVTVGDIKGCTIIGSDIKIRPVNAVNTMVYKLKNGANTYVTASAIKNRVEHSMFVGHNINVDVSAVSQEWVGDFGTGDLKTFGVNGDTTKTPVQWMLDDKTSRIKNVFMFGDSIHTTTGIFNFSKGYDMGLSTWFLSNSGRYELATENRTYVPIQGIMDAFIHGRDIYISSTSGSLESINAFGKFVNIEHSWITVFGRYNEWYSAEIERTVGRDFFVVANGRSTSVGGGIYNTGAILPYTQRYNMFTVTDRGVTKVRSLVKSGAVWRSNFSYAHQYAKMATSVEGVSRLYHPSGISSVTDSATDHSSYIMPNFTETVRTCFIMSHTSTGHIYPNLLRNRLYLTSASDYVELSDDISFLNEDSDNLGHANLIVDSNISDYSETVYAPIAKLSKLYSLENTFTDSSLLTKYTPLNGIRLKVPGKYTVNFKMSEFVPVHPSNTSESIGQFVVLVATSSSSSLRRSDLTVEGEVRNVLIADNLDLMVLGEINSHSSSGELVASFTTTVADEDVYLIGYHIPSFSDVDNSISENLISSGIGKRQYLKDYLTISFDGYLQDQAVWNSVSAPSK